MFPNNDFKKSFFILLVLVTVQVQAQDHSFLPKAIRTNIEYQNRGEYGKALEINLNALKGYEKNNDAEGITTVYTNIGNMLFAFSKYKESLSYLDKAKQKLGKNKNPLLNGRLYNEYGKNYTNLGLFQQSNVTLDKARQYIEKIPNEKQRIYYLGYNYLWKKQNFLGLRQMDSLRSVEKKFSKLKSSILSDTGMADYFIANKIHLDSAEYYLNKALSSNNANTIDVAITWFSYGDLYTVKNDHEKALEYYFKSLKVFQKVKQRTIIRTVYDSISSSYKAIGDVEKSDEYLRQYSALNDSLTNQEKAAVNIVVDRLLQEEKEEKDAERNKLYLIISIIVIGSLVLIYLIRKTYLSKHKKDDKMIKEQSLESQKLKMQVNKSFDQIIKLAESGSPFFLTRFKEVYPDFYQKIMDHDFGLTDYDLKLCAYIRLNISSKEIAQYENITVRAVEARKYRLKKKLELSAETDLNKWILDV